MLAEKTVFEDNTEDISAGNVVADLEITRSELPLLLAV